MRFPLGSAVTRAQLDADPYPVFARLRAVEPVTWAAALGQWFVTRRDIAMEVLRDHERFRTDDVSSPIHDTFGAQLLSTEGDLQRRYKLACAPPFNARAVEESRALQRRYFLKAAVGEPWHTSQRAPHHVDLVDRLATSGDTLTILAALRCCGGAVVGRLRPRA